MPSNQTIASICSLVMNLPLALSGYALALGRAQAAWRFAHADLRRASALAAVSAAWDIFRRDAGAGDVGPAHENTAAQLLLTDDPRRDAMLLWLVDHGAPPIAEAAATIAAMVAATHRFGTTQLDLLARARDALVDAGSARERAVIDDPDVEDLPAQSLATLAVAIEGLRNDADFVEGQGSEVRHALPNGTLSHYVAAEPGGCWALNLALLTANVQPSLTLQSAGLVSRALFRNDLEADEIEPHLIERAGAAHNRTYMTLCRLDGQLSRGTDALVHLSRNSRARDAWLLVAALGACKRVNRR
ncbi:hypothetical protein GCM10008023_41880 [Sphingomonas glacialis]|uniref:Uncharacterized protein n=2 Tax=Sphingomonas glacialis TaxID=658225 RepID=A0ABQ3LYH1_9SPHN|nr:hypothetical protein GCM10008023_41880 [Sphingomonas glacialis]